MAQSATDAQGEDRWASGPVQARQHLPDPPATASRHHHRHQITTYTTNKPGPLSPTTRLDQSMNRESNRVDQFDDEWSCGARWREDAEIGSRSIRSHRSSKKGHISKTNNAAVNDDKQQKSIRQRRRLCIIINLAFLLVAVGVGGYLVYHHWSTVRTSFGKTHVWNSTRGAMSFPTSSDPNPPPSRGDSPTTTTTTTTMNHTNETTQAGRHRHPIKWIGIDDTPPAPDPDATTSDDAEEKENEQLFAIQAVGPSSVDQFETSTYDCSSQSGGKMKIDMGSEPRSLRLVRSPNLCVIMVVTEQTETGQQEVVQPVAQSYSGRDWEAAAGHFSDLEYDCRPAVCLVSLPPLNREEGEEYYIFPVDITSEPAMSVDDEIARFLEQTTFGPTRADIQAMSQRRQQQQQQGRGSIMMNAFISWTKEQMDPSVTEPTLHRAFFRRRLTSRSDAPSHMGVLTHPCQKGTRYRLYAFSPKDFRRTVEIETLDNQRRSIRVDGELRTVVSSLKTGRSPQEEFADGSYEICRRLPQPFLNVTRSSNVILQHPVVGCQGVAFDDVWGNPPIQFYQDVPGAAPQNLINFENLDGVLTPDKLELYADSTPRVQEVVLTRDLHDELEECSNFGIPGNTAVAPEKPVFVQWDGRFWLHDPRHVLRENTVENPLSNGGGDLVNTVSNVLCSTASRTFLNEEGCTISTEAHVCGGNAVRDVRIDLNYRNIQKLYEASGGTRFVYAIDNLEINNQNPSPCEPLTTSRWVQVSGSPCASGSSSSSLSLQATTREALAFHLANSDDDNEYMRDIFMPDRGKTCDAMDRNKRGMVITVNGECYMNVHPNHLQVFDMTYWTEDTTHPGNKVVSPNPIKAFALDGKQTLVYPRQSHGMDRWEEHYRHFHNLGRLGDKVYLSSFPSDLLTEDVVEAFNALDLEIGSSVVVCGSPGEVANDLSGGSYRGEFDAFSRQRMTTPLDSLAHQRKQTWTTIALQAKDQLRQRMAWALSQILVVTPDAVGDYFNSEGFLNYFDIFVRHAFGNYRDILLEVAYSPVMARMLTYLDSKSTGYQWEMSEARELEFPDENMAREIMQLFTVGLYKLTRSGNRVVENGDFVRVYLNDDIEEYSRMWTGFRLQPERGNVERPSNLVDPMFIEPLWRDQFPKMGLNGNYVGDRYPLCRDLPKQHFLLQGAKYRRIGSNGRPELQSDPPTWGTTVQPVRMKVTPNSELYSALCGKSSGQQSCQYPMNIVLDQTLACMGDECRVDTIRTIEIDEVFYEYVRRPCVEQGFFDGAKKTVGTRHNSQVLCADPRSTAANGACCTNTRRVDGSLIANSPELYWGERMTFETASNRCDNSMCTSPDLSAFCRTGQSCSIERNAPSHFWSTESCQLLAKIDPSDATVAIVHSVDAVEDNKVAKQVQEDTKTFFRVHWRQDDSKVSDLASVLSEIESSNLCWESTDGAYVCPITVSDVAVFSGSTLPSVKEVLEQLRIGSLPPDVISNEPLSELTRNGVTIYNQRGKNSAEIFDDSIVSVVDEFGRTFFLKNERSEVQVMGTNLSFRNPPHFIGLSDREVRDMEHETAATIDQYFYHPNTAPFLAIRFAQRFGNSNPTPRYIAAIAEAFRSGSYNVGEENFGKGVYGDLEATIAAVLFDAEARDSVLDFVFGHGSLKEPLLKLIGTMRALGFNPKEDHPLVSLDDNLRNLIGQEAYEYPSVFSFFMPEFELAGSRAAKGGLVTPEADVLSTPKVVATMNGIFSLIRNGLIDCNGGFGEASCRGPNDGVIDFLPTRSDTETIVKELSTLLTAGRLNSENRKVAERLYDESTDKEEGLALTQQLIASSAEFHSTGKTRQGGNSRPSTSNATPSTQPYKAILVLNLDGGMDSWNMLVPHTCEGRNDDGKSVRSQYNDERGALAFIESERSRFIVVDERKQTLPQPCSKFVVHDELEIIQQLYDDGDLAFFANMGVLDRPVDKYNYAEETVAQLFSHNSMQLETKRMDPFQSRPNTGVLGRTLDVLELTNLVSNAFAIDRKSVLLRGTSAKSPDTVVVDRKGQPETFNPFADDNHEADITHEVFEVNNVTQASSNAYGDLWSESLTRAIDESESLKQSIGTALLREPLGDDADAWDEIMATALKLLLSNEKRGVNRDVIEGSLGGWDHHSSMKPRLRSHFKDLNRVLTHFVAEIKAAGLWENVTLVIASDFARTMTPNTGGGSDHAWGGHYFMLGGAVEGGQIHGQYPFDITSSGPLNIGRGRGRMIPELSWESLWNGVVQWFGVPDNEALDQIMPNRKTPRTTLFDENDLFKVSDGPAVEENVIETSPTTSSPSSAPTSFPTSSPTSAATSAPSTWSTMQPNSTPTTTPKDSVTVAPTEAPSPIVAPPTTEPKNTEVPTEWPTEMPTSAAPTPQPTRQPATLPTLRPALQIGTTVTLAELIEYLLNALGA